MKRLGKKSSYAVETIEAYCSCRCHGYCRCTTIDLYEDVYMANSDQLYYQERNMNTY